MREHLGEARIKAWVMESLDGVRFIGLSLPSGDYSLSLGGATSVAIELAQAIQRANDPTELPAPEPPATWEERKSKAAQAIAQGLAELGLA